MIDGTEVAGKKTNSESTGAALSLHLKPDDCRNQKVFRQDLQDKQDKSHTLQIHFVVSVILWL